ncbi:MAG: retropepsin-like aspartic protease [Bacillati bacterium]
MEEKDIRAKITISCGNTERELDAIFDSGAPYSFMSPDIAMEFSECLIRTKDSVSIGSADKRSIMNINHFVQARLKFMNNVEQFAIFLVSKEMKEGTLIIGRKELDGLNISITPDGLKANEQKYKDLLL